MQQTFYQPRYFIYWITGIGALGGLLFGFDTGVIAGALPFINQTFHPSIKLQEILVSSVILGALVGALISGRLADHYGRRQLLLATALLFIIGTTAAALAPYFPLLLAGRWLVGIAIGISSYTTPLFIAEMAPASKRGGLVLLNAITITGGEALAFLTDYLLAPSHAWRMMYGVGLIPAFLLFSGMLTLPETPRWLALKGRLDAAQVLLQRIHPDAQAEAELAGIRQTLMAERASWRALFTPALRPVLIIGLALGIFQQFFGINTIMYYGPSLFQAIGFHSTSAQLLATFGMGVVNTLMSFIALLLVDRLGRRTLLLFGSALAAVSLAVFGGVLEHGNTLLVQALALLSLTTFIAGYCLSVGSLFWLMIAEIYPLRVRSVAMSLATAVQWGANFVISITFLSILNALGPAHTFWLYGSLCVSCWFFVYYRVPETKGVSLEQIEKNIASRKPSRELGVPLKSKLMANTTFELQQDT